MTAPRLGARPKSANGTMEPRVQELLDRGWPHGAIAVRLGIGRSQVARYAIQPGPPSADATPWLSTYARAFLDGVLACQGYVLVQMEDPRAGE